MGLAFEQRPKESAKAFAAFRLYLEMGAQRSLAAVAGKLGKSKVLMERWSRRHRWCERVDAYAQHLAEAERLAIEGLAREKAIDWQKAHPDQELKEWKVRTDFYELCVEKARRWMEQPQRLGTLSDLARLAEAMSKLGRLAAGMPTEVKSITTEVKATLEVEWEVALKRVYGGNKAAGQVVDAEVIGETQSGKVISDQSSVNSGERLLTSSPTEEVKL